MLCHTTILIKEHKAQKSSNVLFFSLSITFDPKLKKTLRLAWYHRNFMV